MAATKRYMNVKSFTFEIDGGSTVTLTGNTKLGVDFKGNLEKFSGDGDRYATTVVNSMNDPEFSVDSADVGTAALSLVPGVRGTATAVVADAVNVAGGVGSGELSYEMTNAVIGNNTATHTHKQFSSTTLTIGAESSDGLTNPIAVTVA